MTDLMTALERIQANDPDGGVTPPTPKAYDEHEAWAVATYGQDVWNTYAGGGWGAQPEV